MSRPRIKHRLEWSTEVTGTVNGGNLAGTIYSSPVCLEAIDTTSWQLTWAATGSPTGTLSFEASNNYDPLTSAGTWVTVTAAYINGLSSCHPAGTAGDHIIVVDSEVAKALWLRVRYTVSSGTGTIYGWVFGS